MHRQTALAIVVFSAAMCVATAVCCDTSAAPMAGANMPGMPMSAPAEPAAAPIREAYTRSHAFLIKLRSIPTPIPFEKYFTLEFAVYDGRHPTKALADAHLAITAGMRHGLKHGFAHGMQSTPRIQAKGGSFTVSGMYFPMLGPWTLKVDVERNGQRGTAYFTLPCCGR
jgi:hypothetical protein